MRPAVVVNPRLAIFVARSTPCTSWVSAASYLVYATSVAYMRAVMMLLINNYHIYVNLQTKFDEILAIHVSVASQSRRNSELFS